MKPKLIQRRAPLTLLPMKGKSTMINKTMEAMNTHGATFSQVSMGTWNTSKAAMNPITKESACRIKNWFCEKPLDWALSFNAIEAEYTITKPHINKPAMAQMSDWSKPLMLPGAAPVLNCWPCTRTGNASMLSLGLLPNQPLMRSIQLMLASLMRCPPSSCGLAPRPQTLGRVPHSCCTCPSWHRPVTTTPHHPFGLRR